MKSMIIKISLVLTLIISMSEGMAHAACDQERASRDYQQRRIYQHEADEPRYCGGSSNSKTACEETRQQLQAAIAARNAAQTVLDACEKRNQPPTVKKP